MSLDTEDLRYGSTFPEEISLVEGKLTIGYAERRLGDIGCLTFSLVELR